MAENIMMPDATTTKARSTQEDLPLGHTLTRYWILLKRYFWLVLIMCALGGMLAHVYARHQPRVYQTHSKIIFHQSPNNIFGRNIERVNLLDSGRSWQFKQFWNTQRQILQSRSFAETVVRRAKLLDDTSAVPTQINGKDLVESQRMSIAIDYVLSNTSVSLAKDSRVAIVTIHGTDAKVISKLATEYAKAYVDYAHEFQSGGLNQMVTWFDSYVASKRSELTKAQKKLHEFKHNKNILSISHESRQNLTSSAMEAVSRQYNEVQSSLAKERAMLAQVKSMERSKQDMRGLAEMVERQSLLSAIEREALLEEKLAKFKGLGYNDKWRQVEAANNELLIVRRHISDEISRIRNGIKNRIGRLERERTRLKAELANLQKNALALDKLGLEYNQLRDNSDSLKLLYKSVLKRSEELDINSMYEGKSIEVLEVALQPKTPISPNVPLLLVLGVLGGLFLGVGSLVLIDALDHTIKSEEDVMRHTDRPILGVLPRVEPAMLKSLAKTDPSHTLDRITHLAPRSAFAEGIKSLRTNLTFISPDNPPRLLLVTSPGPGEGKTLVSTNMAIAMAQSGLKTIIIDGDMRRPRLHKAMSLENQKGLSSILLKEATLEEAIINTEVEHLSMLPCGPIPPNPSELLYTDRFSTLVKELSSQYDRVIFDSPPLGAVTDALILSHKVDAVIVLLMFGKTRNDTLRRTIEQLTTVGAPFMGCVMNNLTANAVGYGYSYYYYRSPYHDDTPTRAPTNKPNKIAS